MPTATQDAPLYPPPRPPEVAAMRFSYEQLAMSTHRAASTAITGACGALVWGRVRELLTGGLPPVFVDQAGVRDQGAGAF